MGADRDPVDDGDVCPDPHVVTDRDPLGVESLIHDRDVGVVEDVVLADQDCIRGDPDLIADRHPSDRGGPEIEPGVAPDGDVAADEAARRDRGAGADGERRRDDRRAFGDEARRIDVVPGAGRDLRRAGDACLGGVADPRVPERFVLETVVVDLDPAVVGHAPDRRARFTRVSSTRSGCSL